MNDQTKLWKAAQLFLDQVRKNEKNEIFCGKGVAAKKLEMALQATKPGPPGPLVVKIEVTGYKHLNFKQAMEQTEEITEKIRELAYPISYNIEPDANTVTFNAEFTATCDEDPWDNPRKLLNETLDEIRAMVGTCNYRLVQE